MFRARRWYPEIELENGVVAVTGAARGIGRATAQAFVRCGARVAIGDIDLAEARRAAAAIGPRARAYQLDVTYVASFREFLANIRRDLGELDVLVNNAGIMPTGAFLDQQPSTDETQLAVNLYGTMYGMRAVAPGMLARGGGHIVNIASMAGVVTVPGLGVYCAGKHAVTSLSQAVRAELRAGGASVSTVLPSAVRTELVSGIRLGGLLPTVDPEDVAHAVVRTVRTRKSMVAVPRWLLPVGLLSKMVPEPVLRLVFDTFDGDRALHPDQRQRAGYTERIETASRSAR